MCDVRRWVVKGVMYISPHLKVCRDGALFVFCESCGTVFPKLQLTPTVAKGTKAPTKAKVLRFERSA